MMVILLVLMIAVTFCSGQDNAKVTYEDECNKVGHTLTIKAEYTGNGIPSSVSWSYSGDVGSFLEILTSNCDVFGSVPVGFPDSSRLSYECVTTDPSLPPNIFKLKVSGLLSNETDKTWGATFTPPVGAAPAAVELGVPTICTTTTTTTSTTSTTTSTSTTTTTPASTTTITPASTTRTTSTTTTTTKPTITTTTPSTSTTTPSTTTTTPSTSTTTPASTTSTMPITTTTMRMPITSSKHPATSTKLSTISLSSTKSSNEGLSDEMIIVIVIVPVGVIALVGTIIFFCLFYHLRMGKRKPASHERHKHGKHYKGNIRTVQQHQQQPYILYGRGHTRESNHKETKKSRSLHYDDRYNWYDGYHLGSQVKQNPVYKDDRNLDRLYYNESLPRYDDYWSGYTKRHVYPSHTCGYHYRPDYHGDSRRHGNRQHSQYPIYSIQQEYINPSYSYMGY